MKKSRLIVFAVALLSAASLLFTGCLSTSKTSSSKKSSSSSTKTSSSKTSSSQSGTTKSSSSTGSSSSSETKLTVSLYDNCPENTYALAAELALRATMEGYKGVTKLKISGTPTQAEAEALLKYYGFCFGIKTSIEKGTGKPVTLTFNTNKDGSGVTLEFSDLTLAAKSLLAIKISNSNSVYAIYKY